LNARADLRHHGVDTLYGAFLAVRDADQNQFGPWTAIGRCTLAGDVPIPRRTDTPSCGAFRHHLPKTRS
jgi:hypothetical protein